MSHRSGQTIYINWILSPVDWHLEKHPELNHLLSIAYNLRMAAHSYAVMPIMPWARECEHTLAIYRRFHYPHRLESAGNYAQRES